MRTAALIAATIAVGVSAQAAPSPVRATKAPTRVAEDVCKPFAFAVNTPGDYFDSTDFRFRMLKGMKVAENQGTYIVGKFFSIHSPRTWQDFVLDRIPAGNAGELKKYMAAPPHTLSAKEITASDILGPYGKPYKETIRAGKLRGGERYAQFMTAYPIAGTKVPGRDATIIIVLTADNRIITAEFLRQPDCSIERNEKQMALLISSLEIKYPQQLPAQSTTTAAVTVSTAIATTSAK